MGLAGWIEAALLRTWWRPELTASALLLRPAAVLYGWIATRALRQAVQPPAGPVPVLVVGNLIVGGAGKTPAVLALVQAFQAAGRHPGVVTRGYGGRNARPRAVLATDMPSQVGDEALLLSRRAQVPVWVGRDRAAAVAALCAEHPAVDVILADDGLQHHRLARAAELLVFDDRGIGNGLLLPAGPLRQALPPAPGRTQRVLYSGSRVSTRLAGVLGRRSLSKAWPLAAWRAGDATQAVALQALRGRRLLAAAGLAAPDRFFDMLVDAGLNIQRLPLPDHHAYATLPWPRSTPDVLTTEKDAVKLDPARIGPTRVWVLPLDFQLPAGLADDLLSLLPKPQTTSPERAP
jgi:tetraacyldisaccharide 4'-kinase